MLGGQANVLGEIVNRHRTSSALQMCGRGAEHTPDRRQPSGHEAGVLELANVDGDVVLTGDHVDEFV